MPLPLELPTEVIYSIIDILGRPHPQTETFNKETLKSCALIGKAYVEVSQKYLFRSVTIQLRHRQRLSLLYNILQTNAIIGTYVQELVLLDVGSDNHRIYQEPRDDTFDLTLTCFPGVKRLEILSWAVDLDRFDWDALRRSTQLALKRIIEAEQFVSLRLSFTRRWPLSILTISPGLRCLDLDFSELYDDISQSDASLHTSPLKLSYLKSNKSSRAIQMLCCLAMRDHGPLIDFSILDELQYNFFGQEDMKIFGQLMSLVGQNLRRLKLVVATDFTDDMLILFLASVNAHRLENLEYLEFSIGDEDHKIRTALVKLMTDMNRSFKLLEIKIAMWNVNFFLGEERLLATCRLWGQLDKALSRSSFCNLRTLTLDIVLSRKPGEPVEPELEPNLELVKQEIVSQFGQLCRLVELDIDIQVSG